MQIAFDPQDTETWRGGYYEAAMVIGTGDSCGADVSLKAAILKLWSDSRLRPAALDVLAAWSPTGSGRLVDVPLDSLLRIYGAYQSPTLGLLPFTSVVVREDGGEDWLYACVPLGGIADSGAYPFDDPANSLAWRESLERELATMVLTICQSVPIRIAAIGFEIAGRIETTPEILSKAGKRWVGYVAKENGSYTYWPTTNWL